MLKELIISDFAIVDRLQLHFSPAFNVLTGETGAGKSIIIDAVNALLGERADSGMIRAGSESARVEGIFELDENVAALIQPFLETGGLEGDEADVLLLGREIRSGGRHLCRVNGRVVTLGIYRSITEHLIDIHGQGDHMSLFRVKHHIESLDRYGGLVDQCKQMTGIVREIRHTRRELQQLLQDKREIARQVDLLSYQIGEIVAASLQLGEDEQLKAEQNRLANAEHLMELATESYRVLQEEDESQMSALDLMGLTVRNLANLTRIDPELGPYQQIAEEIEAQTEDLANTLRSYCDNIEYSPARLREVEERLSLISNLKRKYGESIEDILAFAEEASHKLDNISHSAERIEELQAEEQRLLQEGGHVAAGLSQQRREVGDRLAGQIEQELADLRMEQTCFQVDISHTESEDGLPVGDARYDFGETGYDKVEFLIAANVGEPLRPLVKTASGGETARLMLALKVVLSTADPVPTLIFDEIDSGVGGRIGSVVGRKLWDLTSDHQVLCVTHLPQIASFADNHYRVYKQVTEGRTQTQVSLLDGSDRIGELAQMLGSDTDVTWRNAQEMSEQIAAQKEQAQGKTTTN